MRKDILTAFLYVSIPKSYLCALPPCLELNFVLNTFTRNSPRESFLNISSLILLRFCSNQADALNLPLCLRHLTTDSGSH